MTLLTDTPDRFERALKTLDNAFKIAPTGSVDVERRLILDRLSAE